MTLITDGGSTKCDWILLDEKGEVVLKTQTRGLNPAVISEQELQIRIEENTALKNIFLQVSKVDFYGAGCGTSKPTQLLKNVIQGFFVNANVTVLEDTTAAVHAATQKPGIVCILGTGSNSCYFDGEDIHSPMESLGFILMDEASGNYFGKRLIQDYYYKKMPATLAKEFARIHDLTADEIKLNIYKKPNPNMYLASFAEFVFRPENDSLSNNSEINIYFYSLLSEGIYNFIEHHILCFKEAHQVPVHFIGSIAHYSEEIIKDCFKHHQLKLGTIIRRPIDGLIKYYQQYKIN